ncbi:outer membrane protein assembly factor BamD [Flavobacterium cyanobacteriorum]|uniref:Outer membrane protein assembly factor BamD n=1 Tax=Flavobacterium cyanobacteriorum TaxID=2022802 RepID=A0A255YVF9_9FLAO|nr:outer membrane protein assembly factor BamD [Flavobacterium cyanobacteriorum]OYQ33198.1 outer membrane protein assembly factor BamD [Flavobacterium cyanobacteriorum]
MAKYIYIFIIAVLISSCSPFQKALKSEDVKFKNEVAADLYNKGKYEKAIRLFEQIAPSYKGKPQAERLFYMFAQSYYKTKQYYLAGYQFESFAAGYPRSEKMEEASFLGAKSYYFLSPEYSLDQVDTNKAIDKLQNFIDNYPNSQYLPEANQLVKELREKLEKKAYEIAKQYNTIMDYKAAVKALDNFIIDYPGTPYKEDAMYYKLNSAYQLAINSVPDKMLERLQQAKASYAALVKFRSDTKYKKQADEMLSRIDSELQKFSK